MSGPPGVTRGEGGEDRGWREDDRARGGCWEVGAALFVCLVWCKRVIGEMPQCDEMWCGIELKLHVRQV